MTVDQGASVSAESGGRIIRGGERRRPAGLRPGRRSWSLSRRRAQSQAAPRLGWLDALRGIAALTVALHHFGIRLLVPHGTTVARHLDLGLFGVMLFFLVSGYIVPASLERRGDLRAFWAGRLFRIYPLLILVTVATWVVLARAPHTAINPDFREHLARALPANALLLQDVLGAPNLIGVMWTLCYEMVFYYFVTALFTLGWARRSGVFAVGFAAVAAVLGGALVPGSLVADEVAGRHLVLAGALIALVGLACVVSGNAGLARTGALLLGGLGLVLVFTNGRSAPFETMMVFATMFAGTVVYRAQHGQLDRLQAACYCGFVLAAGLLSAWMYDRGGEAHQRTWTTGWTAWASAYLGAWVLFAAGIALRHRRFPRALTWLGTVSYSVYLIHWLVIDVMDWRFGMSWLFDEHVSAPHSVTRRLLLTVGFLAAVLTLSQLTYRLVELPGQRLGRRLLKAVTRRSERPTVPHQASPAAPGSTGGPTGPVPTAADQQHHLSGTATGR